MDSIMNRKPTDYVQWTSDKAHRMGAADHTRAAAARDLFRGLHALERGRTDYRSRHDLRVILVRRISRRIESTLPDRFAHGEQTADYALALGGALALPEQDLRDLHFAALLHDIGLILLPLRLLAKQQPLAADDYALVQSHPRLAADLLEPFPFLHAAAVLIAHHHEHWDGSGYPFGLRGPYIPVGARILAIADTFDMQVRAARAKEGDAITAATAALGVLAGTQLDPALTAVFQRLPVLQPPAPAARQASRFVEGPHPFHIAQPRPMGSHRFDDGFLASLIGPRALTLTHPRRTRS
jgi:HD-GYP domain-containing protein (c-di-GMP phosphodiesterase class II)